MMIAGKLGGSATIPGKRVRVRPRAVSACHRSMRDVVKRDGQTRFSV
jgi:hypothetical protein